MRKLIYLQDDGAQSAQELRDTDVIGLPIVIAQVLLTVWDRLQPDKWPYTLNRLSESPWVDWAAASRANYEELWNYGMDLLDEHHHRFGSRVTQPYRHGCTRMLTELADIPSKLGPQDFDAVADPFPESPEQSRASHPTDNLFYTNRERPTWLAK